MPSKSVLRRGFKAEAERKSEKCRSDLGLSKFASLDAFQLASHLAIPIVPVDTFTELPEDKLAILSNPDKFDAMWMPNEDGDKIIIHNNHHSAKRQQSNLMHELAHILEGHSIPVEAARLCLLYGLHYYNKEQEEEAKFLGSCLQISRPALQWAIKNGLTPDQISDHFNASIEMVRFRLNASGVLKQYASTKTRS
jgi:hypothetical protein